jgi:hypothetical protein
MFLDGAVADPENLRDLVMGQPIYLAQYEDAPAQRRQTVDRGTERLESTARVDLLIGGRLSRVDV